MANTHVVVGVIIEYLILAALLILPAIGAYFLSRKTYGTLKKKESKWAMAAGVLVFIGTYLATLFAIVCAMAYAGLFRR
jgi:hypothetical protein